ncbi:fumarylacetoacetate hydrolase family protein [Magnetospirillum gryphiswaldense]|uniref:Fumarylacetoacetate (FAA) hydrolase family protein n=1 Tax=Magnetospirillum gryphiswaldense TaxID=55518 RepID=A4U4T8_9PROT|nr:fumarylacetoacetate hydrolase family protein [Magnetospirillum gryphiswaldense]AVM72716.1 Ureidoglycolate lyase [Magnetospirillum gryphiswaldense MSR-1]AVM76619.1 Ureidoglycolate lyase [Magnetospirillum gryphiswaldense]CAM77895.1 fumarylacetoacetate (FAA) hydrolase family protein [Magnetospirillum gryphiswaldense MSR-1]
MRLVRWGDKGAEKPGLVDADGVVRDLSGHCADICAAVDFAALAGVDAAALPVVPGRPRLGVPVAGIGNILCIGLNYHDHATEIGLAPPAEPVVFSKHTGALAGPFDDLVFPAGTQKLDWEVELAVLIGRPVWQVGVDQALSHVAGYMTANDVSARDWQMDRGGQWIKGKSGPGFCPLGPYLVPAAQVPDPQALGLWTEINGIRQQDGRTADMVFGVAEIIAHLSHFMALAAGDVILTGTPAGVGMGRGLFLQPGDVMAAGVDGLGSQRVVVR